MEAATARMAFLAPRRGLDAQELGAQVAALDPDCGPGGRHQGGFEPGAALSDPGRAALAGAFVVARAQACPGYRDGRRRGSASCPRRSPPLLGVNYLERSASIILSGAIGR